MDGMGMTPRYYKWQWSGDICFIKNLGGYLPKMGRPKTLRMAGVPIKDNPDRALPNTERTHWGYSHIDVGDWM